MYIFIFLYVCKYQTVYTYLSVYKGISQVISEKVVCIYIYTHSFSSIDATKQCCFIFMDLSSYGKTYIDISQNIGTSKCIAYPLKRSLFGVQRIRYPYFRKCHYVSILLFYISIYIYVYLYIYICLSIYCRLRQLSSVSEVCTPPAESMRG